MSGNSGIYCTPKTEDRKIVSDYMIVWLNQTPVDFAVSLSNVDSHGGVIRNSKGDSKTRVFVLKKLTICMPLQFSSLMKRYRRL